MIMMNLFSVFDPVSYLNISMNWGIMFLVWIFMMSGYYIKYYGMTKLLKLFKDYTNNMFSEIALSNKMALIFLVITMFMYIMLSNLLGLFPFIFTSSAHLNMTLGLGLVMWMSFFLMGWFKNFIMSMAHMVPEGSPLMLAPILVIIESISHLIRPFTLAIRLAANMMAGHLIIGLLSSISMMSMFGLMMSMIFQSMMLILELCVAIIQGFVYSILLMLYVLDYY